MNREKSEKLFEQAKEIFPGGVNSPVRAFKSVGGSPLFMKKGKGAYLTDEDDQVFLDYCGSWGPLILGHANDTVIAEVQKALEFGTSFGAPTKLENELGELILKNHPYIEMIRFVSSGTEAVMSAIRLSRAVTKKNKIVKFDGCYHGHTDALLVKAGSGLITLGNTSSLGVPEEVANDTIVISLDHEEAINEVIRKYKNEIACLIIEPIPANNGLLLQRKEFLQSIRKVCTENNILLLFDEVISGFRIGFTGAAGYFNIQPDIITFGKIIGGGLPVGAYAGSKELMRNISPIGNVYQAGTLSGNPISITAGIAQLKICLEENFYSELELKTKILADRINLFVHEHKIPVHVYFVGSIFWISFSSKTNIRKASDIPPTISESFKIFHAKLLENKIYFGPSGYEVCFISAAHTMEMIYFTIEKICNILAEMYLTPSTKKMNHE